MIKFFNFAIGCSELQNFNLHSLTGTLQLVIIYSYSTTAAAKWLVLRESFGANVRADTAVIAASATLTSARRSSAETAAPASTLSATQFAAAHSDSLVKFI